MKGLTTYQLNVLVHHPKDADTKHEYKYFVNFFQDEHGTGNKTYMQLTNADHMPFKLFDLRYNDVYNPEMKIGFICLWADVYWSGKDNTWKLESIEVKKVC